MCVIINNPSGKLLPIGKLHTAFMNNPHGVGFMWHEDGKVHTIKALMGFNDFLALHEGLREVPHAIHFRWRTAGDTSDDRCHPFPVFTREQDGFDLYMMHNGTFEHFAKRAATGEKSDTQLFAESMRENIRNWNRPLDVLHPHVLQRIGRTIGGNNKILFMGSGGLTRIVNSNSGWFETDEGPQTFSTFDGGGELTWYSNKYSFIDDYRKRDKMEVKEDRRNALLGQR
jgi:hypothetical protein